MQTLLYEQQAQSSHRLSCIILCLLGNYYSVCWIKEYIATPQKSIGIILYSSILCNLSFANLTIISAFTCCNGARTRLMTTNASYYRYRLKWSTIVQNPRRASTEQYCISADAYIHPVGLWASLHNVRVTTRMHMHIACDCVMSSSITCVMLCQHFVACRDSQEASLPV